VEGGELVVMKVGTKRKQEIKEEDDKSGPSWWTSPGREEKASGIRPRLRPSQGIAQAKKLAVSNAKAYAGDVFATVGGIDAARKLAGNVASESNPVRTSDIFLSIEPGVCDDDEEEVEEAEEENEGDKDDGNKAAEKVVSLAIYLYDPIHRISFLTASQSFPAEWAEWLEGRQEAVDRSSSSSAPNAAESSSTATADADANVAAASTLHPAIQSILEQGGPDPREWVAEWIEEALGLAVGVVAQRYVAKRMGVGRGSGSGAADGGVEGGSSSEKASNGGDGVNGGDSVLVGKKSSDAAPAGDLSRAGL